MQRRDGVGASAKAFNEALQRVMVPALGRAGFVFDGKTSFRKVLDTGQIYEIEVQRGVRSLASEFAINLGFFGSKDAFPVITRLGLVCLPTVLRPFGRLIYGSRWLLRVFGGASESWWVMPNRLDEAIKLQQDLVMLIERHAFAWFSARQRRCLGEAS